MGSDSNSPAAEFSQEEAERQLEIAVDWCRYAGLLAYEDKTRVLFLERSGAAS